MSGGGKGGSQTTTSKVELPPFIEAAAKQNLKLADEANKIGYVPYQGNTVAALTPMQKASMQNTQGALGSFNMGGAKQQAGKGVDPYTGLAMQPTLSGGVLGYSPMAGYEAAKAKIAPAQRGIIDSLNMDPVTGAAPKNPLITPTAMYGQHGTDKKAAAKAAKAAAAKPKPKPVYKPVGSRTQYLTDRTMNR